MVKVFSGKGFKAPRGSLRSLSISSPLLVMVVVTFKFSNPSTLTLGVEALRVRLGAAVTTTAEATKAKMETERDEEYISVEAAEAVETVGLKCRDLSSLPALPIAQSSFISHW